MNPAEQLINQFYTSFGQKDLKGILNCYHPEATFSDPVFGKLSSKEVKAMWHLLATRGKDLELTFSDIKANETNGSCHWEARYTFSKTGRKVHNKINASFRFRDGKIIEHRDQFDLYKWMRMALGIPGLLLGWTPFLQNKVRKAAKADLAAFIKKHPEYQ